MAGTIQFNRDYAAFGNQVKPHEKTDDVGSIVTEILSLWFYPIGAVINAKISGIWLGEGEKPAGDLENIDLLFKMGPPGEPYIEIILRSTGNPPAYGGWVAGQSLDVTDEIVNGHRVLVTTLEGTKLRWEYSLDAEPHQYVQVGPAAGAKMSTATARKLQRKSSR